MLVANTRMASSAKLKISISFHRICLSRRLLPLSKVITFRHYSLPSRRTTWAADETSCPAVSEVTDCRSSEVESHLCSERTWSHIMRSAEGREEVVKGVLVGDIDGSEPKAPFALVAMEEVVVPDGGVEQAARGDARRVVVVILGVGRRNADQVGSELRGQARRRQGRGRCCPHAIAGKAGLKLLVGGESAQVDRRLSVESGRRARTECIYTNDVIAGR